MFTGSLEAVSTWAPVGWAWESCACYMHEFVSTPVSYYQPPIGLGCCDKYWPERHALSLELHDGKSEVFAAGFRHTCGVDSAGGLQCWGWNEYSKTDVPPPPAGQTWAAAAPGGYHTCGLDSAGGLWCWGLNEYGQTDVPALPAGQTWVSVEAGGTHTCGLDSARGLRCWGNNTYGQTTVPALPAGRTWAAVAR